MSRINSNTKGKSGELEFAKLATEKTKYTLRRTAQYNGKELGSLADVVGLPGMHVEVKRVERLNIHEAIEQAIRDCQEETETPIVAHRKNRTPWLITMLADDFFKLYNAAIGDDTQYQDELKELKDEQ